MSGRSRARVLSIAALMGLGACKESIPEGFEELVPTKNRGDVNLATATHGGDYGAEKMLIITYGTELSDAELNEEYAETIRGQGYTKVSECKVDGAITSTDYLKPSREHVQVFFRLPSRGETGPMLHVFKSSKIVHLRAGKSCVFTEAASEMCASVEGDTCRLEED